MPARLVIRTALVAPVTLLAIASPALAKTYDVTRTNDPVPGSCKPSDCSLREAISAANVHAGADKVVLKAGRTYDLSIPARNDDANVSGDLDVTGPLGLSSGGHQLATVDAHHHDRVIDAFASLAVSRLEIRNGQTKDPIQNDCGCGIRVVGNGNLRVTHSRIVNNRDEGSGSGGGILKDGMGDLVVKRSVIAHNRATLLGGGIEDESFGPARVVVSHTRILANGTGAGGGFAEFGNAPVKFIHATIASNHSTTNGPSGGGIWDDTSRNLVVTDTRILNNRADGPGGGIVAFGGPLTITRSTIAGNAGSAGSGNVGGGGITNIADAADARTVINASTISGNRSDFNGGGIENFAEGGFTATLKVTNSTIAENRATEFGGGIDSFVGSGGGGANVTLNAATVVDNNADSDGNGSGQGGGLQNGTGAGSFSVKNSLIALNQAPIGPDCAGFTFASGGHNLLGTSAGCSGFGAQGDLFKPNPKLGGLATNGGPTQTIALKHGSPAIGNAGPGIPKRDQRGVKRDSHPDIGAYERR